MSFQQRSLLYYLTLFLRDVTSSRFIFVVKAETRRSSARYPEEMPSHQIGGRGLGASDLVQGQESGIRIGRYEFTFLNCAGSTAGIWRL